MLAVGPPIAVGLWQGTYVTVAAILVFSVILGGGIYGEMYQIIRRPKSVTEAVGDGHYDILIDEQRYAKIDVVYRGYEEMAANLNEEITEAEQAQADAEDARKAAESAQQDAEELAVLLQEKATEFN